jgi:hypothetical protein
MSTIDLPFRLGTLKTSPSSKSGKLPTIDESVGPYVLPIIDANRGKSLAAKVLPSQTIHPCGILLGRLPLLDCPLQGMIVPTGADFIVFSLL